MVLTALFDFLSEIIYIGNWWDTKLMKNPDEHMYFPRFYSIVALKKMKQDETR